jgi:hypothetical protein
MNKLQPRLGKLFCFGLNEDGLLSLGFDIPLAPFDSGLSHVTQPEETIFDLSANVPVNGLDELEGRSFDTPDADQDTIYLGSAHNPVKIERLIFGKRLGARFDVELSLLCRFSFEGVGQDEHVVLNAKLVCDKLLFGEKEAKT